MLLKFSLRKSDNTKPGGENFEINYLRNICYEDSSVSLQRWYEFTIHIGVLFMKQVTIS